jgi:hypothetical protein
MAHKGKKQRKRASRPRTERGESRKDARLRTTRVTEIGSDPVQSETWAQHVSPARLPDGRLLWWYPPQSVAFPLLEAKRYCGRGVKARLNIVSQLRRRESGGVMPPNERRTLDCLSDLHIAVLYAFTAIESFANHSIDQLDDNATLDVEFKKGEVTQLPKSEMIRRLAIGEKLSRVVPMLTDGRNIKGTKPWELYRHLKALRDELVHVKERGYSPDPDTPTAYDKLMRGEADNCAREATGVIIAARPTFLPEHVLAALE